MVLGVFSLASTACGGDTAAQGDDEASTAGTSASPAAVSSTVPGVFFPVRQPVNGYMMAQIEGKLVLDDRGCLRLRYEGDGSLVPVWAPGFGVDDSAGEVRVLDAKGRVVARVGDEVNLGGGEGPPAERLPAVDGRTKRELRDRCPGEYWLASPDVDVIRQG